MSRALLACLLLAACGSRDAERRGDEAYVAGRFADAHAAYQAGRDDGSGQLHAKAAAAAMRAGMADSAIAAWLRVVEADPARSAEAADGLESIARIAVRERSLATLRRAIGALGLVAPERPVGRHALALLSGAEVDDEEAIRLLPGALAAAPAGTAFDSLMLRFGRALAAAGRCDEATDAYRAVLRRTGDSARRTLAARELSACALRLGQSALEAGRAVDGDRWFGLAARLDSGSAVGRRALLGMGDARVAVGDTIAAVIVWQRLADEAGTDDSTGLMAAARLRALGVTDSAGDSTRMRE